MQLKNLLWIFLLSLLSGSAFLFIKIAVQEIPPLTLVTLRTGIAAILLYLILRIQGYRLLNFISAWKHIAVLALINSMLPFVLISWGEMNVDSALAAILIGTTPLFTIVLAHFVTTDDRLTTTKIIGTGIGFIGLIGLIVPSFTNNLQTNSTLGLLSIILASVSFASAVVYARKYLSDFPILISSTAISLLSTLYVLPISLFIEHPFDLPMPSLEAIGALLALAIFSTTLASLVYFYILKRVNASAVSMTTYLIPLVGTILGIVILNEQLTWNTYISGMVIIIGVMIVNGVFKFRK